MWSNLRKIGGAKTWASNQKHLLHVMFIYILQKKEKVSQSCSEAKWYTLGEFGTHLWGNLEQVGQFGTRQFSLHFIFLTLFLPPWPAFSFLLSTFSLGP